MGMFVDSSIYLYILGISREFLEGKTTQLLKEYQTFLLYLGFRISPNPSPIFKYQLVLKVLNIKILLVLTY